MPRRLIISILIVLILGIIGGTAVFIIRAFRGSQPTPTTTEEPGSLTQAPTGSQQVANPTGDDDGDGLNNADERLWGTDPTNPDTDGDGYLDGEEVAASHNPTIPSPNDQLPEGFEPGKDITPIETAPTQPVAVDQFFVEGLDLSGPKENLTEKYQKQYPEDQRTADTVAEFTNTQPIITKLPRPNDQAIQVAEADSPGVVAAYLNVAGNTRLISNKTLFDSAMADLFNDGNPNGFRGLALSARLYQEGLLTVTVPPSAASTQRLLLGYSELLAATFDQIANNWNSDPLKAMLALRQLEEIDKQYFPLIAQEIDRLAAL